jgi:hypothetical protein
VDIRVASQVRLATLADLIRCLKYCLSDWRTSNYSIANRSFGGRRSTNSARYSYGVQFLSIAGRFSGVLIKVSAGGTSRSQLLCAEV